MEVIPIPPALKNICVSSWMSIYVPSYGMGEPYVKHFCPFCDYTDKSFNHKDFLKHIEIIHPDTTGT